MNSSSGGSRLRADERDVLRRDRARVDQHAQRHAPQVPARRGLRRVEIAVRVDPDEGEPVVTRRERLDGADVRAAAAAEHERPLRQVGCDLEALHRQRVLRDDRRLRIRQPDVRGRRHLVAARSPCARHAHEAGGELAAARVALVLGPERDRRVRSAVGALGAKPAHSAFSYVSLRRTGRMPTLS
jgi:hypothetical protein